MTKYFYPIVFAVICFGNAISCSACDRIQDSFDLSELIEMNELNIIKNKVYITRDLVSLVEGGIVVTLAGVPLRIQQLGADKHGLYFTIHQFLHIDKSDVYGCPE